MDPQLIQRARYILRKRFRQVQTAPPTLLISSCNQLMNWLSSHSLFSGIVGHILIKHEELAESFIKYKEQIESGARQIQTKHIEVADYEQYSALCALGVKMVAELGLSNPQRSMFFLATVTEAIVGEELFKQEDSIEQFKDHVVDSVYEYLDEQLDSRNIIFGLLLKYKQHVEWFRKVALQAKANDEKTLARDLQEFIFLNGTDFVVEPVSASGESDLILKDSEEGTLIVDAKYIKSDQHSLVKRQLADGFHQVFRYCHDYNESHGFLVAFKSTEHALQLDLEETKGGLRYLNIGGKTIYYLDISIASLPTASKAGKPKEMSFVKSELISSIE